MIRNEIKAVAALLRLRKLAGREQQRKENALLSDPCGKK